MAKILVVLQSVDGKLPKSSLAAITAASQIGGELKGVVLGAGAKGVAEEAAKHGLSEVLYSEAAPLEKYLATNYLQGVVAAAKELGSEVIIAAGTSTGKDLLPRVAAALDAGQASDVVAINSDGSFKRPMYAGNAFADVVINTPVKILTVRPTAFAAAASSGSGSVRELSVSIDSVTAGEVISYEISKGARPELGDAEIVVSGGRALQSAENFEKVIFPLADSLHAAVGASRAAVDSGYAPNDWQVGQTGKVVAPNLYVAVGISGAIQHLAGMKDSKVIVAINKDPDAPIYEVADYGLVADLYDAVPKITEAVKKIKG